MGMNLTLSNIDKHIKQYFSTRAYKILYLLCGSTYKDSKTSLFYFLWFFPWFTMHFQNLQPLKLTFKLEQKLFRN